MDSEMTLHDDLRAALAAYALNALPEDQIAQIKTHLATCPECREELKHFQEVASWIGGFEERPLPAGFADRVVARAFSEREVPPVAGREGLKRMAIALGVALLLAAIFGGLAFETLRQSQDQLRAARHALKTVVGADRIVKLAGRGDAGRIITQGDRGVLVAVGLTATSKDNVYQLWLSKGPKVVSAGTFEPTAGFISFDFRLPINRFDGALVTVEPKQGSPKPNLEDLVLESH